MIRKPSIRIVERRGDSVDVDVQPAQRADAFRTVRATYHGDGEWLATRALLHLHRDPSTGTPLLEVARVDGPSLLVTTPALATDARVNSIYHAIVALVLDARKLSAEEIALRARQLAAVVVGSKEEDTL